MNDDIDQLLEELEIPDDACIHASDLAIRSVRDSRQQASPSNKPVGLWYSLGDSWIQMISDGYMDRETPSFIYQLDVRYAPDDTDVFSAVSSGKRVGGILRLEGYSDAVAFGDLFGEKHAEEVLRMGGQIEYVDTIRDIRWADVARIFDGIEIKLGRGVGDTRETYWLYGWDVHSGCIWGSGGITGFTQIYPKQEKTAGFRDRMMSSLRSLIRETLLSLDEAATTPASLPPGYRFSVETGMSSPPRSRRERASYTPSILGWYVRILDEYGDMVGSIRVEKRGANQIGSLSKDNCLDAYEVTHVATKISGLGPLMYDVAAELAGEKGIMSDRFSVSPSARRIWDFYVTQRPDVEIKQLPEDCNMTAASEEGDWKSSPLSKIVVKRDRAVIDELERLGIIDWASADE